MTESAEFLSMFGGPNGKYWGLLYECMLAVSKRLLTRKEVNAALRRIRAGADKNKIETLEKLVQMANKRLIEETNQHCVSATDCASNVNKSQLENAIAASDAANRRMQARLDVIKEMIECKKHGVDFPGRHGQIRGTA
jgi:hypothetical protein